MEIKKSTKQNAAILYLKGRFDAHEVAPVREWFKDLGEANYKHWVVNLADVNFIDSSALSTLVQGLKLSREKGCELVLCELQPAVRIIFELTRLDKAFLIVTTEQEAY